MALLLSLSLTLSLSGHPAHVVSVLVDMSLCQVSDIVIIPCEQAKQRSLAGKAAALTMFIVSLC